MAIFEDETKCALIIGRAYGVNGSVNLEPGSYFAMDN
jgi:hypothetical protein